MIEGHLDLGETGIEALIELVRNAGERIMEVYRGAFEVRAKADESPITVADERANEVLIEGLVRLTPGMPVISEETRKAPPDARRGWTSFWLVDPLDGTREFVERNGEFTVNLALIERDKAVLGLVGVPAEGSVWVGDVEAREAFVDTAAGRRAVTTRACPAVPVVIRSRRHGGPAMEQVMARLEAYFGALEDREVGSALKLVRLAAGEADIYPRIGPTSQWDIAAGHALLIAAGGRLMRLGGGAFEYPQGEDFLNPDFVAWGDPRLDIVELLENL